MATSFNKKELEKKKEQKRKEKQKRKEERKAGGSKTYDDMIAYVDENGVITSTPPDPDKKQNINVESIMISMPKKNDIEEEALSGRVEHFNSDKGYGFIKNLAGTEKYFFHISNAPENIGEGDMVIFELEQGKKSMNAVNIAHTN